MVQNNKIWKARDSLAFVHGSVDFMEQVLNLTSWVQGSEIIDCWMN